MNYISSTSAANSSEPGSALEVKGSHLTDFFAAVEGVPVFESDRSRDIDVNLRSRQSQSQSFVFGRITTETEV